MLKKMIILFVSQIAIVVLLAPVSSAAVAAEGKKEVNIRVYRIHETIAVDLPPNLDFEIDGRYLHYVQVEKGRTHIHLNHDSIEIYTAKSKLDKPLKQIKIEAFQVGPGFTVDPSWHIIYERH